MFAHQINVWWVFVVICKKQSESQINIKVSIAKQKNLIIY